MKIYKTKKTILIEYDQAFYPINEDWDSLLNKENLYQFLSDFVKSASPDPNGENLVKTELMAPIGTQEVWASGVTYYKSREARMEESKDAGGGDFYDRVYNADRPELFMKAPYYRVVGSTQNVRIRKDSKWNVPEPELTLAINNKGKIIGYTAGNDMSSRDIEGVNPLYLPQAKCYDGSTAIGPCVFITEETISPSTTIKLEIERDKVEFEAEIEVSQIKRKFVELVEYLYRETTFPTGAFLMTGTGIVPPNEFTLQSGDQIRITIDNVGTLVTPVE